MKKGPISKEQANLCGVSERTPSISSTGEEKQVKRNEGKTCLYCRQSRFGPTQDVCEWRVLQRIDLIGKRHGQGKYTVPNGGRLTRV